MSNIIINTEESVAQPLTDTERRIIEVLLKATEEIDQDAGLLFEEYLAGNIDIDLTIAAISMDILAKHGVDIDDDWTSTSFWLVSPFRVGLMCATWNDDIDNERNDYWWAWDGLSEGDGNLRPDAHEYYLGKAVGRSLRDYKNSAR